MAASVDVMRFILAVLLLAGPARAAVLTVGADGRFPTLEAAARAAAGGDTIRLGEGEFFECAVLAQQGLVLEGAGAKTVITDRTCEGKALLVLRGDRITVRNLVLARARVADRNGAGIRLEGQGLRVEGVRFENDEVGILAGIAGPGTIEVVDSVFRGGGVAGERPSSAINAGAVAALRVTGTRFEGVKGIGITSAAGVTEVVGSRIETGAAAEGGPAVVASGRLLARDNVFVLGPEPVPRDAAMVAEGGGAIVERNRLENRTGRAAALLLDWTGGDTHLSANVVSGSDVVRSTSGKWRHEAGAMARGLKQELRGAAGEARRTVRGWLGD